jgi:hypothetical protein
MKKTASWHIKYFFINVWNEIRPVKGKSRIYPSNIRTQRSIYPDGYPYGRSEQEINAWRENEYKKENRIMKRYAD